ncbi:LysR family transcriptional regulator [Dongia soli]|uniref:LysR family transcriptional regulator n=1 Tax=Dongia soli TaxID=600628 RepID=A0ABU5EEN9_9PROT|nr:LysR family transcriptional regulator [Dongia soli]MDY0884792.1 LysR family transcriptional regulator [Dongia soli]
MDINLARTFLEVVSTGSFVTAAERLNLTQTAVSARIRSLEEQLGRRLFIRNKAGARLTPSGQQFRRYATAFIQMWERARQQVALPPGRAAVVSVGAELSLWSPLLSDWLIWMHRESPDIALRAEVDTPQRLLDRVQDGALDLALLYSPEQRPELVIELLIEEQLVMVSTEPPPSGQPPARPRLDDYIYVDWGAAFAANHQVAFPELSNPAVVVTLGPLALTYLLTVGGTGYFRLSAVQQHLANGRLHRVPQAPVFSHSVYLVYSTRGEGDLIDRIREGLRACAAKE